VRYLTPPEPVQRYEWERPGELVHVDIKRLGRFAQAGHRVTGKRTGSVGAGWEYAHVAVDDCSRFSYVEILPDQKRYTATRFWLRAVREFARRGIHVQRVLTDNGGAYRSRPFRKACRWLGIATKRTRPYRPQTNGKAERFIQTLQRKWAYAVSYASSEHRRAALPAWMQFYNEDRPHASLNHKTPLSRLLQFAEQRSYKSHLDSVILVRSAMQTVGQGAGVVAAVSLRRYAIPVHILAPELTASQAGMRFAKGNHQFEKTEQIAVLFEFVPIQPGGLVVLIVGIVVAVLAMHELVARAKHRRAIGYHEQAEDLTGPIRL